MRYFIIAYFFLIILLAGIPLVALADNSDQDSLAELHWRAGQKSLDASLVRFISKIYDPKFLKCPNLVFPDFGQLGCPNLEPKFTKPYV